ncbi:MAG TPA: hypothetical protein IAC53_03865 [Candidatus Fimenecus excrementigallinarum]|uniref:Uncharacterized protein n=1 Tax=Candidatus Fimenecus excrementigallinarum TaxID=2840816 RepID=A0A9D1LEH7_9FIRM|nr:hypothetical protein [Candidatus Fimenecus excrementigallinarum]
MIIEAICDQFIKVFTTLLSFVSIPQVPEDVLSSVNSTMDEIIERGSQLIDLFIPYDIAKVLLLIVIVIELVVHIYHFIMWVIRKIPMAGMS